MQLCTKCILPETFPGIRYDSDGVCNYCHEHQSVKVLGEDTLIARLENYRNIKTGEYDCVIPISGGRDSTYVLHQIVTKYKMNVITLTVDSGFILSEGYRNIETATKALGVPHVWLRNEKKIKTGRENTRIKFQGWLKNPSINTIVPVLNAGDKTMNLQMARFAKENGIPVVMGGNFIGNCTFEEEHWKRGYMGAFADDRGAFSTADKIKLVFMFGLEFLKNPYNLRLPIFWEYATGGAVYFFEPLFRPRGIDFLGYWDHIYWREKEVEETVIKELGWKGAEDHTTTWRIDDSAYPLINYLYLKLVGFTEHDEMYSKMIREGQLTRDEAIKRVEKDHNSQWINGPRVIESLKELGVTKEETDKVLDEYRERLLPKILNKR
ncbi:hypothetical protein ACFLYQ_07820 [Chloroflexota bacterium]